MYNLINILIDSPDKFNAYDCPTGTYGDDNRCIPCPPGYTCNGTTATITPAGTFAITGSDTSYDCSYGGFGLYSAISGLTSQDQCILCPEGQYCDGDTDSTACPEGFFCPAGSFKGTHNICPAGYVTTATGMGYLGDCVDSSNECKNGVYCGQGATSSTSCDAGTRMITDYLGLGILDCLPCERGTACPTATTTDACGSNHFCPINTSSNTSNICYPGTKTLDTDLYAHYQCDSCDAGTYCELPDDLTSTTAPEQTCPAGHYCPSGTKRATEYPCPPGTRISTGDGTNTGVDQCEDCPVGYFCPHGSADVENSGDDYKCPLGHYCPVGTTHKREYPCEAGTYQDTLGQGSCEQCTIGHFCPEGSYEAVECPIGEYQDQTGQSECLDCPEGQICSSPGTSSPVTCDPGTYSNEGLACVSCPKGYYCPSGVSKPLACPAGMYCSGGTHNIIEANIDTATDPCEDAADTNCQRCKAGYYCPERSVIEYPCPKGTYRPNDTGKIKVDPDDSSITGTGCSPCPEGFYCLGTGDSDPSDDICDDGYECLEGSSSPTEEPCDPGYYSYYSDAGYSATVCTICPAGYYCPGATIVPEDCPEGYYCPEGSSGATPCPIGTYNAALNGESEIADCLSCPGGYFCSSTAMDHDPTGNSDEMCQAGFYCGGGATVSSPKGDYDSGDTNGVCPQGHYCELNTTEPEDCPLGTFNKYTGGESSDICVACTAGRDCNSTALVMDGVACAAGSYCLEGTGTGSGTEPVQASAGHFAKLGSSRETACPAGTYQPNIGQASCLDCDTGHICPYDSSGRIAMEDCGEGMYCDDIAMIAAIPCPPGTFSSGANNTDLTDCGSCTPGQYCDSYGLIAESGACAAGYYCVGGDTSPTPARDAADDELTTSGPCPAGYYCPEGSDAPIACSEGTYSNKEYLTDSSECISCDRGNYCDSTALTAVSGICEAGYICEGGSIDKYGRESAGDAVHQCPIHFYCPAGAIIPIHCAAGTYIDSLGAITCDGCPEGYYCSGKSVDSSVSGKTRCPRGWYCEPNTITPLFQCAIGTYDNFDGDSTNTGLTADTDCSSCPPGVYCSDEGMYFNAATDGGAVTDVFPLCKAGYMCGGGCTEDTCGDTLCTAGYYCPAGTADTADAIVCPKGTYNPLTGAKTLDDCLDCPAGYFCDSTNLTSLTGLECPANYYCPTGSGASEADKIECLAGHYCPLQSSIPIICDIGTYSIAGQSSCTPCDEGKYCPDMGMSVQYECPAGYKCSNTGLTIEACEEGTYRSLGLGSGESCVDCSEGKYCPKGASSELACPSGYYCLGLSAYVSAEYADPVPCDTGTYMFESSTSSTSSSGCVACPSGRFCPESAYVVADGTADADIGLPVFQGYYCENGSCITGRGLIHKVLETDPDPENQLCTEGNYCPGGTATPQPCPAGTYQPNTGSISSDDCLMCPAGSYCSGGESDVSGSCMAGYYCETGSEVSNPAAGICPVGSYCISGSDAPIHCPASQYQDVVGQSTCKTCAAGTYCPKPGEDPIECPAGYYCPSGASSPTPCPAGRMGWDGAASLTGLVAETDCQLCTEGYACVNPATVEPTILCAAGYFCATGTSSRTPSAGLCPVGYYCPEGSITASSCPLGTYNSQTGRSSRWDCLPCSVGQYCATSGLESPTGDCSAGYYCDLRCSSDQFTPIKAGSIEVVEDGVTVTYTYESDVCVRSCSSDQEYYDGSGCVACGTTCDTGSWCVAASTCECKPGYDDNAGTCVEAEGYRSDGIYYTMFDPHTSATPASNVCPMYYSCAEGSIEPLPCAPATYQDETGQATCKTCTEGNYCVGTVRGATLNDSEPSVEHRLPQTCPMGLYCPLESTYGLLCPAGSYSTETGMISSDSCISCPSGSYCMNSIVVDLCNPGYVCRGGASSPTPSDPPNNEQCPLGYYCPEGSKTTTRCPTGKWTFSLGASTEAECLPCEPGYTCTGDEPALCDKGYYCVGDNAIEACPTGHYNDVSGGTTKADCKACPAGYYCDEVAMSDYSENICPTGSYCPLGSKIPTPCPAGTYNELSQIASLLYCLDCPAGYYCESGTSDPVKCDDGYFCPEGSTFPISCPIGYTSVGDDVSDLRTSLDDSCVACPAGYYCSEGGDTDPEPCTDGYVCTGSATTSTPMSDEEGGYICPAGYYCQASDDGTNIVPCPAGSYGYLTGLSSSDGCIECPANTFSSEEGSSECSGCGSSSWSEKGSSTCLCYGKNRVFQPSDRHCVCEPGYEYTTNGVDISYLDSSVDCRLTVYERCGSGKTTIGRSAAGSCVAGDVEEVCADECSGLGGGTFSLQFGLCVCNTVDTPVSVCDLSCRQETTEITVNADGQLTVTDTLNSVTNEYTFTNLVSNGVVGSVKCEKDDGDCSLTPVTLNSSGWLGHYTVTGDAVDTVITSTRDSLVVTSEYNIPDYSNAHFNTNNPSIRPKDLSSPGISNPIICITVNADGQLTVTDTLNSITNEYTFTNLVSNGVVGSVKCEKDDGDCSLTPVTLNSSGWLGHYTVTGYAVDTVITSTRDSLVVTSEYNIPDYSNAHFNTNNPSIRPKDLSSPGISNPIICVEEGDGLIIDVSEGVYPVYDRASLLSDNSDFDYGSLRELLNSMKTSLSSTTYTILFNTPGNIVFYSSENEQNKTFIHVAPSGISCPTDSILPVTQENLVSLNFAQLVGVSLPLQPWWLLIGILLCSIFATVASLIVTMSIFSKASTTELGDSNARPHQEQIKQLDMGQFASKGGFVAENLDHMRLGFDLPDDDIERERMIQSLEVLQIPYNRENRTRRKGTSDISLSYPEALSMINHHHLWRNGEKLIDLGGFNVQRFFNMVQRQLDTISSTIEKQKEETQPERECLNTATNSLHDTVTQVLKEVMECGERIVGVKEDEENEEEDEESVVDSERSDSSRKPHSRSKEKESKKSRLEDTSLEKKRQPSRKKKILSHVKALLTSNEDDDGTVDDGVETTEDKRDGEPNTPVTRLWLAQQFIHSLRLMKDQLGSHAAIRSRIGRKVDRCLSLLQQRVEGLIASTEQQVKDINTEAIYSSIESVKEASIAAVKILRELEGISGGGWCIRRWKEEIEEE
ncbi:conserved unknown protein, partial [Aduncisulcus paluster]